jgi:hypothetical protein
MKTAIATATYTILALDEDLDIVEHDSPDISIDQFEDEELEVWRTREDGFLFVYCNRLEVGYWVNPSHIKIV